MKFNLLYGFKNILVCDSKGIISKKRQDLNEEKKQLAQITNTQDKVGDLSDALVGADIFVGVSTKDVLSENMIKTMKDDPIIFALANPSPEIMPNKAKRAGALVVASGRSDFPNQINNVLAFPGIFKGALENHIRQITDRMLMQAAEKLAALIKRPTAKKILPNPFDKRVAKTVASVIK